MRYLKLIGAAALLAFTVGCRSPAENPGRWYDNKPPEEREFWAEIDRLYNIVNGPEKPKHLNRPPYSGVRVIEGVPHITPMPWVDHRPLGDK